jgi:hypothetical protein
VVVQGVSPLIWRRLLIRSDMSLATFHAALRLHRGERFTYVYNFIDDWVCDLRLEAVRPLDSRGHYPVCLAGKRAAPPEDCGGAWAYLQRVDRHHVPLEAMAVVATVLNRLLKADDQTTIRRIIGDQETFRARG